ncbi:MAG: heme-binding protein [Desulfuromonadales bacterium]|nr:heme-binding protein [Desulfuromonadales bacterium]
MLKPLPVKPVLTLAVAKQIAAVAEVKAVEQGWSVVIVIVDDAGQLLLLQRLDGTMLASIDIAIKKAVCSLTFKRPTKVFEDSLIGGRQAILGLPGAIPINGGLPLYFRGDIVGAIGVSGVKADEDAQVAAAGVEWMAAMDSSD